MPRQDDYEDAEEYLDDIYDPDDEDGLDFNQLSKEEQTNVLAGMFFKSNGVPEPTAHQAAELMRRGMNRPFGQPRHYAVRLRGRLHHVERDAKGRFTKWVD